MRRLDTHQLITGDRMQLPRVTLLIAASLLSGCGGSPEPESAALDNAPESTPRPQKTAVAKSEDAPPPEPPPQPELQQNSESYPTFGVALTPPEEWSLDPNAPTTGFLGRWLPASDNSEDWRQFAVEVRLLTGDEIERDLVTARLNLPFGRRGYERRQIEVDGLPAVRFDAPPIDPAAERSPLPSPVISMTRGDLHYRLIALLNDPSDTAEIDAVIDSWTWLEPQSVVNYLELGEPQTLFEGLGQIRIPTISRLDQEFHRGDNTGYTLFDYQQKQDAITIVMERDLNPEPADLRENANAYANILAQRAKLPRPPSFESLPKGKNIYVSQVLQGTFPSPTGPVTRTSRYAVWQPRPDAIIRIQMVINNEVFTNPVDLAIASAVTEAVLQSCAPMPSAGG